MHPKTFTLDEEQLRTNWRDGPLFNQPLTPGHQRPVTCLSMFADRVVTGSADHSLRIFNVAEGSFERELFTPKYGHNEWVTSCQLLADGRVLSGGMDSMLCLWDSEMVMCDYMVSHNGSITKVMVDEYNVGASSSYDHSVIIWDLTTKQEAMKLLGPHKSPVLDFDWHFSLLVSGDKDGYLAFWDINEGDPFKIAKCHEGGVSQVLLFSDSMKHHLVITTGISDGVIAMHDMRMNELVYSEKLHTGSVNSVKVNLSNLIVTGGSDGLINLVDIWSGFKHFGMMELQSPVHCVETIHNLTIAGSEDGNVLAYDNDLQDCLWGFGAMESGAVKEIQITSDKRKLVCTGEDITPMLLAFG